MEVAVVSDILKNYLGKIVRVHQFLLMLVLKRRFKRKRAATAKLQNFFRVVKAKMVVRKLRTEIKEKERGRRMEIFTRLSKDQAKLNAAAKKIQDAIYTRKIKEK